MNEAHLNPLSNLDKTERDVYVLQYWHQWTLKGQVTHVHSGKTFPIHDPEGLLALIRQQVNLPDDESGHPGIR
jgi:hypothetical protein